MLLKSCAMPPASRPSDFDLLGLEQLVRGHDARVLEGFALDGVSHGAQQAVRVDPALDQIVLRALLQGLDGKRLVIQAGQDDKWDRGCRGVGAPHGFEALGIGQSQVEEDHVDLALGKMFLSIAHAHDVRQFGVVRVLLVEHLAEQSSVSGIVFHDEEKPPDGLAVGGLNVNDRRNTGRCGIPVSIVSGHWPPLSGGCGRGRTRGYAASPSQLTLESGEPTSMKTLRAARCGTYSSPR